MASLQTTPVHTGPPKLYRRTYVIDRGFQLKYIVVLAVVGAGVCGLFGLMMYLAHADALKAVSETLTGDLQRAWEQIRKDQAWLRADETLWALTAAMAILMAAALSLFGVLITHRVAGPVYVMSHYVGILAKGRYPVMRPLRKTDELRGFFERFQAAVDAMRQRDLEEAQALDNALTAFSTLAASGEARAALEKLKGMRDRKKDATEL